MQSKKPQIFDQSQIQNKTRPYDIKTQMSSVNKINMDPFVVDIGEQLQQINQKQVRKSEQQNCNPRKSTINQPTLVLYTPSNRFQLSTTNPEVDLSHPEDQLQLNQIKEMEIEFIQPTPLLSKVQEHISPDFREQQEYIDMQKSKYYQSEQLMFRQEIEMQNNFYQEQIRNYKEVKISLEKQLNNVILQNEHLISQNTNTTQQLKQVQEEVELLRQNVNSQTSQITQLAGNNASLVQSNRLINNECQDQKQTIMHLQQKLDQLVENESKLIQNIADLKLECQQANSERENYGSILQHNIELEQNNKELTQKLSTFFSDRDIEIEKIIAYYKDKMSQPTPLEQKQQLELENTKKILSDTKTHELQLINQVNSLQNEKQELLIQLQNLQQTNQTQKSELHELRKNYELVQLEFENSAQIIENQNEQLLQQQNHIIQATNEASELKKQNEIQTASLQKLQTSLDYQQKFLESGQDEIQSLKMELKRLNVMINDQKRVIQELQVQRGEVAVLRQSEFKLMNDKQKLLEKLAGFSIQWDK